MKQHKTKKWQPYFKKNEDKKEEVKLTLKTDTLKTVCLMSEDDFTRLKIDGKLPEVIDSPDGNILFWNRGGKVLGVAHLDTYGQNKKHFHKIGGRIYNASLDDRLGAFTILSQLVDYGYDILLTTGEESGRSTAQYFDSAKQYNWIFSFDRGGVDSVLYDYSTKKMRKLLTKHKWNIGRGSFSDISYLEHLGCKGFNLATAYFDYHGDYAYMDIQKYFASIRKFMSLWEDIKNEYLEHEEVKYSYPVGQHYQWDSYPYEGKFATSATSTKWEEADSMDCAYCDSTSKDCGCEVTQDCASCGYEMFDYEIDSNGWCEYCLDALSKSDSIKLQQWEDSNTP